MTPSTHSMDKHVKLADFLGSTTDIELTKLLLAFAEGSKMISKLINNAGISDITGHTGDTNTHGEEVQKLDHLTNDILTNYMKASESCAGYLSEENEDIQTLNPNGKYTIALDPLDGSSNIDVGAPIGTIFSVNQRLSKPGEQVTREDFLQKGTEIKAGGYAVYGSSTMFVFTTGKGVNVFTLATDDHEFYMSHPDVKIPEKGKSYSLNQGHTANFDAGLQNFLAYCTAIDKETSRPYSLRYIGSMVADVHRNLLKGGIFIYPATHSNPNGKLRMLYECIPMAYLTEQAGGKATNGKQRILDIQPQDYHERMPIYIGSKNLVEKLEEFLN